MSVAGTDSHTPTLDEIKAALVREIEDFTPEWAVTISGATIASCFVNVAGIVFGRTVTELPPTLVEIYDNARNRSGNEYEVVTVFAWIANA